MPPNPTSSGHQSGTPALTLTSNSLNSRPHSAALPSRPISPVIYENGISVVLISSINLAVQPRTQSLNHVRSHSVPSLQRQPSIATENTLNQVTLVRDDPHSSSAVNLLTPQRDGILRTQSYTSYFPRSPQLRPLMSPGPVTPMQLEEDLECRFPCLGTSVYHGQLVVPGVLDGEESETETCLELPRRNR